MSQKNENIYHELLGLPAQASKNEIDEAYQKAIKCYLESSSNVTANNNNANGIAEIKEAYKKLRGNVMDDQNAISSPSLLERRKRDDSKITLDNKKSYTVKNKIQMKKSLIVLDNVDPVTTEQYRVLYTQLEQIRVNNASKVFAVTSATQGEGKTITSLNFAYLVSNEFNKKVILVECDLKKPSMLSQHLETKQQYGLVNFLRGEAELSQVISSFSENKNLSVVPAMLNIRDSIQLLESQRMKEMINLFKKKFDYVILDCPPIIPVADMNVLSKLAEGVLLVVRAGKTKKEIVGKAVKSLKESNLLGIVLNGVAMSSKDYYNYY